MATPPMAGAGGGGGMASGNGQSQPQPGQDPSGGSKQAIQEFIQIAQAIQALAKKYPEFTEDAAAILPMIEKGMAKVSGNPQRTPEKQAPPMA